MRKDKIRHSLVTNIVVSESKQNENVVIMDVMEGLTVEMKVLLGG